MHCCGVLIRTLGLARLSCFTSDNDAIYTHRFAFMLYAYWYVQKLKSISLKTQKMSLAIIKFIGDELNRINRYSDSGNSVKNRANI